MQHDASRIDNSLDTGLTLATRIRFHSLDCFSQQRFRIVAITGEEFLIVTDEIANLSRHGASDVGQSSESQPDPVTHVLRQYATTNRPTERLGGWHVFLFRHRFRRREATTILSLDPDKSS